MKITFSVCADYHLDPQYPIGPEGITKIVNRAKAHNVDALVHCGDFVVDLKNQQAALEAFLHNDAGIPAFGCYGNHELEQTESLEELNAAYGVENSYHYRDVKGFRFVLLDTNHYELDGVFHHYPGNYWGGHAKERRLDTLLGEAQLAWLEETLMTSPYPCFLVSHASFELTHPDVAGRDAAKVQEILHLVNEQFPRRVLMCINGHYHTDSVNVVDNIVYFNVNAAHMIAWRPKKHDCFPKEFCAPYRSADNGAFTVEPLSAIVTVDSEGTIDIRGMTSACVFGVLPEDIGESVRQTYGRAVPYISDAHVELPLFTKPAETES